jgi:hypothetical protein
VPSSVTFLGQVFFSRVLIFLSSFVIYDAHAVCVCMLVRVLWQFSTGKRVPVDFVCFDRGIHLLLLHSAELHHHSNVRISKRLTFFLLIIFCDPMHNYYVRDTQNVFNFLYDIQNSM